MKYMLFSLVLAVQAATSATPATSTSASSSATNAITTNTETPSTQTPSAGGSNSATHESDKRTYMKAGMARAMVDMCYWGADATDAAAAEGHLADWLKPRGDAIQRIRSAPNFGKCAPGSYCTSNAIFDPMRGPPPSDIRARMPVAVDSHQATKTCREIIEKLKSDSF